MSSMSSVRQSAKSCSAFTSTTPGDLGFSSRVTGSSQDLAGMPGDLGSSSRVTGDAMRSEMHMPSVSSAIGKHSFTVASDVVKSAVESSMAKLNIQKGKSQLWLMHQCAKKVNDDGAEFFVNDTLDYDIFIRPSYLDMYELLDEGFRGNKYDIRTDGASAALLTGTPGIGKTMFGLVLAKMVVNRKKPALVFYSNTSEDTTCFWQGETFSISESDAVSLVRNIARREDVYSTLSHNQDQLEIWSIGDSLFPIKMRGIIKIYIASPGAQTAYDIKQWVKAENAMKLVFPPCTWNEICHIRTALYRENAGVICPLDKLRERFKVWGGVPRTILSLPQYLDQNHEKFLGLRIKDAIPYLGTFNLDHNRYSGSIFHLFPAFRTPTQDQGEGISKKNRYHAAYAAYWWATTILENKAWLQFLNEREADVLEFIETLNNDASLRGKFWEQQIHHLIERTGIEGTLRDLETGDVTENFKIDKSATSFFQTLADINPSADYWRPVSKIHKTCDSYKLSLGAMFQMTVGKTHDINISGLEEILRSNIFEAWRKKHTNEYLKLIFVVHKSTYQEFGKQNYKYTKVDIEGNSKAAQQKRKRNTATAKESRRRAVEAKIRQYVLEVDLEKLLKKYRMGAKAKGKRKVEVDDDDQIWLPSRAVFANTCSRTVLASPERAEQSQKFLERAEPVLELARRKPNSPL